MPDLQHLISEVSLHLDPPERETVHKAFEVAQARHEGQFRTSGEPYIIHPVEVARILSTYRLDAPTLAAALLHDVVEDTGATLEEISEEFGEEVAMLVDGVTKLTSISSRQTRDAPQPLSKKAAQAENLRKIFLAMARDLRVILIKLADRLHNMRTLGALRPDKKARIAQETLEIFAPIASRLGVWEFKSELEDLSFRYTMPSEYAELEKEVLENQARRQQTAIEAVEAIRQKLLNLGIDARIEWRPKHLYSIYRKMQRTGRTIEEIYDLLAVRVIVHSVEECYSALGAVHALWIPLNDRIKDYIAKPKSNNYRSLHTTVYGPGDQPIEIQIRTWEMHKVNEAGIAAHWAYKEGRRTPAGGSESQLFREIYPWIRAILDWQADSRDAQEYIEHLKVDLLANEVFVFTPRGDVIDLPNESTPVDFAYRIHTEVGHRCVGARVNGRMVPLDHALQNADIVEIQTSKSGTPSLDWLRLCKSLQAKAKIRAWFKKERREENVARGKDLVRRELARNRSETLLADEGLMRQVAEKLNFVSVDDLLASLGYGETTLAHILSRIQNLLPEPVSQEILPVPRKTSRRTGPGREVLVRGMDNILTRLSKCCAPVPGDQILGFITLGKGVSVHRTDCPNIGALTSAHPERMIEVEWTTPGSDERVGYLVDLEVTALDRHALLSDVMSVINEARIPLRSCRAFARKDRACIKLGVETQHRKQFEELMKKIRKVKGVLDVTRLTHVTSP
ncbi:MAG: RelA/SpoT family protein [Candidatus Xenobium sp.]